MVSQKLYRNTLTELDMLVTFLLLGTYLCPAKGQPDDAPDDVLRTEFLFLFKIQKSGKTVNCTFCFWTGIVDTPTRIWTGTKAREYECL